MSDTADILDRLESGDLAPDWHQARPSEPGEFSDLRPVVTAQLTVSAETYELLERLAASHGITAAELASILVESGLRPIATLERQQRRAG